MRIAATILLAFLIAFALRPDPPAGANSPWILPLHLLSIAYASALLILAFSPWILRSWRPIQLVSCIICFLLMLAMAVVNHESDPLCIVIMGILVTDGAMLPWGVRWQALLNIAGLATFGLYELLAPASALPTNFQLISMIAAAVLGQTFAALMDRHRRELREQMLALQESQTRLKGEIAEREQALRERERTERELIAAREAALAASQAKSEFLSSMSHEIRTPLNALLGTADLLAETRLDSDQHRFIDTLVSNGNALLDLINSILDLARIESGRLSLENIPFDLRDLLNKCAETFALRAQEKNLALNVNIAPGVRTDLIGDSLRLRQILFNLIGNAIKFTERGEVRVLVELDPSLPGSGCLRFSVADTGIGIAPDKLPTLFSAFTQADSSTTRKYGGSGLGLAIVQRLVGLMGGKVWVESEPGHGSVFNFTALLAVQPGAQVPTPREPKRQNSPGRQAILDRPLHILLADDSPDNRLLVRNYLRVTPYQVDEAENGKIAIEKFIANHYDLVLMDIQMPEMDGYDATRAMRLWERERGQPRTPILALTASALEENMRRTSEAGCDLHVTKPVKRDTLLEAIRSAVVVAETRSAAPAWQHD